MKPKLLIRVLMLLLLLMAAAIMVSGQVATKVEKAEFTSAEREAIRNYYTHVLGTLAPASLDRKGFSPEIERELRPGNRVPMKLEKKMERLPRELSEKLRMPWPGHEHFRLGNHILLLRKPDMTIVDIVRDIAK
jgi:hypothetical protein